MPLPADLAQIYTHAVPHRRLGEILIAEGLTTPDRIDVALVRQHSSGQRLGSALIGLGLDGDTVSRALAHQHGVPAARRKHFEAIRPATLALVPCEVADRHLAVPLGIATRSRRELIVALRDPCDEAAVAALTSSAGLPVLPAVAPECYIHHFLEKLYSGPVRWIPGSSS